jgi:gliding motility-associated-like protein
VTNVLDASITNPPSSCVAGAAFDLIAASAGGTWSGAGIVNAINGTFDPATSGPGTFMVYYTISGSCGNIDSATVTITNVADATINQPSAVCESSAIFNLSSVTSGGIWSGNGIADSVAGSFSPSLAGNGTHIITYTITGACAANDTVIVTVNPSADASITPVASVCQGSAAFNLSAADAGGNWSGNGIIDNVNGTFSASAAGLGSHTIYYTIAGSCGDIDSTTISVIPPVNTSIVNMGAVCEGSSPITFTAATTGGIWSGTGITDVNNGVFDPSVSGDGTFVISYGITGACGDTSTTSITVNPLPVPSATPSITSGCVPLCVQFTETASTNCTSVSYNFGDGNTSSVSNPSHCFNADGIYSVQITCTDANGCSGTATLTSTIDVNAAPVADITISPSGIISPDTEVSFVNSSTGSIGQLWNFNDPASIDNTSNLPSPVHTYEAEGNYCISLLVTNSAGCTDSTTECILVAGEVAVSVPNIFTPNGDGNNDLFIIRTVSVKELKCSIFDRWGLKVAELNSVNEGWDGRTTSGNMAPDGVYYFLLNVTGLNEKESSHQGFVQLLSSK